MNVFLLEINEEEVVYEEYEDEMIFLNLREGVYYTLSREGADCIIALLGSDSVSSAVQWLKKVYDIEEVRLLNYLAELLKEMMEEKLVDVRSHNSNNSKINSSNIIDKRELFPYKLEKFEDIQDILLFDPVHEVSEEGWPSVVAEEDK